MCSSKLSFLLLILLSFYKVNSQTQQKEYIATRTSEAPKIDGQPFEKVWNSVSSADDFIMLQPDNGIKENETQKSIVKILYDDKAIYVAAYLYDDKAEDIDKQFS